MKYIVLLPLNCFEIFIDHNKNFLENSKYFIKIVFSDFFSIKKNSGYICARGQSRKIAKRISLIIILQLPRD